MKATCAITRTLAAMLVVSTLIHQPSTASAQGTAFTYQGRLTENGEPADGLYDLHFTIHDSPIGGTLLGGPVTNSPTAVSNGLFTVTLDFGSGIFTGAQRWLEVSVRTNDGGAFTSLEPRQAVTPSPYAIHAAGVSAAGITGTIAPANIGAGTITGTMLATGSVTAAQLAPGSVTTSQLADGAVSLAKLDASPVPLGFGFVTLTNPTPAMTEYFASSVAALGQDRVLVGAPLARSGAISSAGEAYLFDAVGQRLTTFTNPTPVVGDNFGVAVASSKNGHVLIGASGSATANGFAGEVCLFTTNGELIVTFTNPVASIGDDQFGAAVAAVGTDKVLIGSPRNDIGATNSGAAYLFDTNGILLATYTNPAPSASDMFGIAVDALGSDHVLIGTGLGDEGLVNAGGVYLFHINGDLVTTFTNPTPVSGANFGPAIAAFGSDRVLIGAPFDSLLAPASGVVHMFSTNGARLVTFTNPAPADSDLFGSAVAVVGADKVLIGAFRDDMGATDSGSAYVFDTNGALVATFTNPTAAADDYFGGAVAGLGSNRMAVGAPQDGLGGLRAGTAYIFTTEQGALMPGLFASGVADGAVTPAMLSAEVGVWERSGSNLFYTAGNVGVGTNTPVSRLHVNGTLTATAFAGNGASLTALNASQLTSGTVPSGRLAGADGSGLTQLNASQLSSGTVPSGRLAGAYSGALTFNNPANSFLGNGSGLDGVWKPGGNGGTTPGTHFLGTTDNQPLELKVNNTRVLRLEPTANDVDHSDIVNVIGGSPANTVGAGVFGATISGGGAVNYFGSASNRVDADFSSVGGGRRNTIQSNASASTIGGGFGNTIQTDGSLSIIGGGQFHTIQTDAVASTIGGGFGNIIQPNASFSTIGGGSDNTISGRFGTVPGGDFNVAGTNSFAAGHRAKATHAGAFVWADSTGADFASTANNQFSIRAAGGVRLSDNTPNLSFGSTTRQMLNLFSSAYGLGVQESTLYQRSNFRFSWFVGGTHSDSQNAPGAGGSVVMTLTSSGLTVNGSACCTSDRNAKENFTPVDPREVLEKVAALPITRWNYKNDAGTPHLGPMSQDFYAAFGVGPDNKHIATVDADGVALAAIQGLNQKVNQKETEITELKERLEKLEILLNQKLNGGVK